MKRIIFYAVAAVFILCGCGREEQPDPERKTAEVGIYGDALPIKRGEAGRMLALCLYDYEEIISLDDKSNFTDIDREDGLYKYVNAVNSAGLMVGDGISFRSGDYLTVGEAENIIGVADKSGRLKIEADEGTESSPISYYMWLQILSRLSETGDFEGISSKEMTVLTTGESSEEIKGYVLCSEGLYKSDDFVPESLENTVTEFLVKGDAVIGICSIVSDNPVFERCLVLDRKGGEITVFYGGCKKKFKTDIEGVSDVPFIADVSVKGDDILSCERYTTEKYGRIIAVGDSILFDDDYSYTAAEDMIVYSSYDGIKRGGYSDLISGNYARVVFKDNKAVCALCEESPDEDIIRTALSASEGGFVHKSVEISSDKGFKAQSGGSEKEYKAGEVLTVNSASQAQLFSGRKISFTPKSGGKISVNGKEYEGRIDVISCEGGFNVVCEMNVDTYLYGVVCAEMPSSYGDEALKAQALAARSYVYNQRLGNKRVDCGANIDDTTAFQVYNPSSVCEEAIKAVDKTKGEMILYEDKVITACFYSTSCGISANSGEIWENYKTPEYLSSVTVGELDRPDFSNEEEALKFFKLIDEGGYEADCPYYRWSFRADKTGFKADVGKVTNVTATKRGEGGNVTEVLIEGEKGETTVSGESNIRNLLSPGSVKLNDGTEREFTSLPSSFFAVEAVDGEIYFYGGGYGHGVGMSQNGAKSLAEQGKNYKEIIEYFYKGAKVGKL